MPCPLVAVVCSIHRLSVATVGVRSNIQKPSGNPTIVRQRKYATSIHKALNHHPTNTNHSARTMNGRWGVSTTTCRPAATITRCGGFRSAMMVGTLLSIFAPSGIPMIVNMAIHANPIQICPSHHPTKANQSSCHKQPGLSRISITVSRASLIIHPH